MEHDGTIDGLDKDLLDMGLLYLSIKEIIGWLNWGPGRVQCRQVFVIWSLWVYSMDLNWFDSSN